MHITVFGEREEISLICQNLFFGSLLLLTLLWLRDLFLLHSSPALVLYVSCLIAEQVFAVQRDQAGMLAKFFLFMSTLVVNSATNMYMRGGLLTGVISLAS